jgi:hypothetical protein
MREWLKRMPPGGVQAAQFRRSVGLPCTLPARLLRGLSNQQSLGVAHASLAVPRRYIQAVAVESVRHEHAPRHATMLRSRLQRWSLGMWEMRQGEISCTISTLRALNGIKMFAQGALLGGRTTTTSAIMMRPRILGAIVCGFHWDSDPPESLCQQRKQRH